MRTKPTQGFTLLEALIAVAILGLIGLVTYGTFAHAMDARERAEKITSHYQQIRQAMERMAREISMAYISAHKSLEDPRTATIFVAKRAGNGTRLDFTSFSHFKTQPDAKESDENELSYFVERNPNDKEAMALMRREQNRIDDEPDKGGAEQVLAENISELRFEFYDPKQDRWLDEWDTTSSDQRGTLPMFAAIKLTTKDPMTGKEEKFVTKTRIYLKRAVYVTGTPVLQ